MAGGSSGPRGMPTPLPPASLAWKCLARRPNRWIVSVTLPGMLAIVLQSSMMSIRGCPISSAILAASSIVWMKLVSFGGRASMQRVTPPFGQGVRASGEDLLSPLPPFVEHGRRLDIPLGRRAEDHHRPAEIGAEVSQLPEIVSRPASDGHVRGRQMQALGGDEEPVAARTTSTPASAAARGDLFSANRGDLGHMIRQGKGGDFHAAKAEPGGNGERPSR